MKTDSGKHRYHKTNSLTKGELPSRGQQHCNLVPRFLTAPHHATLEVHSKPFTRYVEAAEMWRKNRPCQMNGCRRSSMKQLLYIPISLDYSPVRCWSASSCVFTHTSFKRFGFANPSRTGNFKTSLCVCRSRGRFVTLFQHCDRLLFHILSLPTISRSKAHSQNAWELIQHA